ncbi:DUF4345 domain-containing protein [Maribacter sp. 2308TA10-17]|uniref:DUF4345 domain-containing protein n=1 Tax=Maribacter sp. 2308TA10-17 TaxID=3386276 RepID=UPI0039BCAC22
MKDPKLIKNLQLGISAAVVFIASFVYGGNPSKFLPYIFGFEVQDLELKNIFRAIMGLYIAFGIYWIIGIQNPKHWQGATISNIIFMGGLTIGRLVSTILDGVSIQYSIGMILEALFFLWGYYNLRKYGQVKTY